MKDKEFDTFIKIKIQALVDMIMDEKALNFEEALTILYNSEIYKALLNESTKIWHFSTPKLYEMLVYEQEHKRLIFPDYV